MRRDVAGARWPKVWRRQNVVGLVVNGYFDLHASRLITVVCQSTSNAEVPIPFRPCPEFIHCDLGDCAGCRAIASEAARLARTMFCKATGDPEAKYDGADDDYCFSLHSFRVGTVSESDRDEQHV